MEFLESILRRVAHRFGWWRFHDFLESRWIDRECRKDFKRTLSSPGPCVSLDEQDRILYEELQNLDLSELEDTRDSLLTLVVKG